MVDKNKFIVKLYGKSIDGRSISLNIKGFTPFFFVKVPDDWDNGSLKYFKKFVLSKMMPKYHGCLKSLTIMKKYKFRGFTNFKKFKFVRLVFSNTRAMRNCIKIFEENHLNLMIKYCISRWSRSGFEGLDGQWRGQCQRNYRNSLIYITDIDDIRSIPTRDLSFHEDNDNRQRTTRIHIQDMGFTGELPLFETKVEPMLKIIHLRQLKPAGWLKIKKRHLVKSDLLDIRNGDNYEVDWSKIKI